MLDVEDAVFWRPNRLGWSGAGAASSETTMSETSLILVRKKGYPAKTGVEVST